MTFSAVPGGQHRTVLLNEAVAALAIEGARADGVYVDGTFGRGGHSRQILEQLGSGGRLIAFDKDPQAIATAQTITDPRFTIVHDSFATLEAALAARGVSRVDGSFAGSGDFLAAGGRRRAGLQFPARWSARHADGYDTRNDGRRLVGNGKRTENQGR